MAADGLFFPAFARLHPRYRTPTTAIVVQGVWAVLLLLTGKYGQLLDYVVFAVLLFFAATGLAETPEQAELRAELQAYLAWECEPKQAGAFRPFAQEFQFGMGAPGGRPGPVIVPGLEGAGRNPWKASLT